MSDHVRFVNQYLTQREIVDYLLATDVYVTPYLDLNQITSGTLAYALGAGKAIVSTRYLHAAEALADGRGLLVDVRDADGLTRAVLAILDDPTLKGELERRAYDYGKEMAWPDRILCSSRYPRGTPGTTSSVCVSSTRAASGHGSSSPTSQRISPASTCVIRARSGTGTAPACSGSPTRDTPITSRR